MSIITRQERERLVLDLYNQGKTFREIAKQARISFRDIGIILKQISQNKTEVKAEHGNNGAEKNQQQEEHHLSLSTQAYKLFSEGKTPIEVCIELNLRESEATEFCREYWNLKQLNDLNMVYEETRGDIGYFVKLYKLAKAKGMGVQQVVDVIAIANNDLPSIEGRFKKLRKDESILQSRKCVDERNLYQLNNQIASTSRLLNSLRILWGMERRAIENLYNEKQRLESLVNDFKSNNEEYLKVKQAAHKEVKSVLNDGKILLKFATVSVVESLRNNPELSNIILHYISDNNTDTTSYGSNHLSFISEQQEQQQLFNDIYSALILEESEKLYEKLTTRLTNEAMAAAAAAIKESSSLPLLVTITGKMIYII
jgi:hypothetical protein